MLNRMKSNFYLWQLSSCIYLCEVGLEGGVTNTILKSHTSDVDIWVSVLQIFL